jgi:hypothetical protein
VSWLFVALIPGLLMLATLGLQRLESTLNRGCVAAADVAEFLAQAEPPDMRRLARDGMPEALDCLRRRRLVVHTVVNPQFRQTRHADSV